MFRKIENIHFVGIGGIGMSGIAEVLLSLGYRVTGSDLRRSSITDRLAGLGALIREGHSADNVKEADVVVYSSAVKPGNVELEAARSRHIPTIPRAEMLAELMRMKYGIAVAGTHGKTTTTSMVARVLTEGGLDPTIVVGGKLRSLDTNARLGAGEYLVCEADESDRSFLKLSPTITVITTLEEEHMESYRDLEALLDTYVEFANRVPFYGCVITCIDEKNLQTILPRIERRCITYGLKTQANLKARDIRFEGFGSSYSLQSNGRELGEVRLKVPGLHNIYNSIASCAVGLELGIELGSIQHALAEFGGVRRRFEVKGTAGGITVVDDYAHHPTEIEVTLEAARRAWPGRIVAVFQPHLYSRTKKLHKSFGRSFGDADLVIVTDVYGAREDPVPGVTGRLVSDACTDFGHKSVMYLEEKGDIAKRLLSEVKQGDMIITMGAGDIYRVGEEILGLLNQGRTEG
jgi:UDP-N-acetylmuramate--alanine ligase